MVLTSLLDNSLCPCHGLCNLVQGSGLYAHKDKSLCQSARRGTSGYDVRLGADFDDILFGLDFLADRCKRQAGWFQISLFFSDRGRLAMLKMAVRDFCKRAHET